MIEVRQTAVFREWISGLKDRKAQEIIAKRMVRISAGLMGDVKYFDGIGELRFDYGPGYRVYFTKSGNVVIILLCGGDKVTQRADIKRAIEMAKEV
ncbi:type II toxin-antitoxin system RelE/ParE family toxin [Bosea sp. ASV33]|uniref:type II toxin-antitoxin system RelE/ParE family toxin n=1 Tax=Bosea sp. ASV33 TaxID=2795106 RepID=UPI0018EB3F15|nr:type II toxin-antitoxin system RelE/ParE family toxin [Bosea sp. ASV33]